MKKDCPSCGSKKTAWIYSKKWHCLSAGCKYFWDPLAAENQKTEPDVACPHPSYDDCDIYDCVVHPSRSEGSRWYSDADWKRMGELSKIKKLTDNQRLEWYGILERQLKERRV